MGYLLIVLGIALWSGAHFFKRAAPDIRARMGDAGKGLVTGLLLLSILVMIFGYRWAPYDPVWAFGAWVYPVNNLAVLGAFYLFAASGAKTRVTRVVRHPQLTAVIVWAAAHLLANGDVASILLFGGLLVWAMAEIVVLNRVQPAWTPAHPPPIRKEITAVVASVALFVVVFLIHGWIGPSPAGI
ncbi:NnrU family protein [Jannaschia sp. S6380]|uniref:NnrU family protein n=1 Tax=Jannaschia sp. S6380 TaxID=2926408 RepID=UPI001FF637EE|nr:NnrU family protein [Jannaschia sp. S6380]MCK0168153.1 NnrU family protein [Jannaschia sp. S6380]